MRILLGIFLLLTVTAFADTIDLTRMWVTSDGQALDPDETNNSTVFDLAHSGVTEAIAPHSAWAAALPGSSWVSYARTGIVWQQGNPEYVVPNNTVISFFDLIFLPEASAYRGALTVMADDSVAVYLNGDLLMEEAPRDGNHYQRCSDWQPGCLERTAITLDLAPALQGGTNEFEFRVAQRANVSFGLDYAGYAEPVPEPATYALIGLGLLLLGTLARRYRSL